MLSNNEFLKICVKNEDLKNNKLFIKKAKSLCAEDKRILDSHIVEALVYNQNVSIVGLVEKLWFLNLSKSSVSRRIQKVKKNIATICARDYEVTKCSSSKKPKMLVQNSNTRTSSFEDNPIQAQSIHKDAEKNLVVKVDEDYFDNKETTKDISLPKTIHDFSYSDDPLPILPSDMRNPYKEELWYSIDELPMDKDQTERRSEEFGDDLSIRSFHSNYYEKIDHNGNEIEYFAIHQMWICREAKKGSATRGYITNEIKEIMSILNDHGFSDNHEINRDIDSILREWEFPNREEVKTRVPCWELKYIKHERMERMSEEEELALDYNSLAVYFEDLHISIFDAGGKEVADFFVEAFSRFIEPRLAKAKVKRSIVRKRDDDETVKKRGEFIVIIKEKQSSWIIDYNSKIIKSKLNFLTGGISKKYNIDETVFKGLLREDW